MQKTDFDFEIVVGEDCSTDNTREILREYDRKYPGRMKLLFREKNLGRVTLNVYQTSMEAKGEYLAYIEGDDFWTDPEKLQVQADFLEAHPAPEGKKYALVMDNAPWHKKTIRLVETEKQPEYADIRESVTFVKLPPYSPDLNPIEQVWRITRRENTHNVFFAAISILEETVDSAFEPWTKPNDQLRTLCSFK